MKKVSVIMPAYNAEKFIEEAIKSILSQTEKNWELLILDDGSTDDTLAVVRRFNDRRITVFKNNPNQGYLQSCNRLFYLAQGEYITFLDADDVCSPTRIEKCLSFLNTRKADFLTTNHSRFNQQSGNSKLYEANIDFEKMATDPIYYPTVCCATVFLRSELLKRVGGYHPVFNRMGAEDYHWLFRLSLAGKGVHLNKNLYQYRQHKGQIRQNSQPENFIAHSLDKAIRTEYLQNGIDLLNPSNAFRLSEVKASLLLPFEKDATLIKRHKAIQLLNSNQKMKAVQTIFVAVLRNPINPKNWSQLGYVIYVALRRIAQ